MTISLLLNGLSGITLLRVEKSLDALYAGASDNLTLLIGLKSTGEGS